jgi:hypothetical protein
MIPKVSYGQLGTKTGSCRLSPPDADRERARPAFQNCPTLSVRRAPMPTVYKYRLEKYNEEILL